MTILICIGIAVLTVVVIVVVVARSGEPRGPMPRKHGGFGNGITRSGHK